MRLPMDANNDGSTHEAVALIESDDSALGLSLLLTVVEVAELLGVSRSTVYELMYAQRFPSVKLGGCRRVRRSDLEAFVRALVEVS